MKAGSLRRVFLVVLTVSLGVEVLDMVAGSVWGDHSSSVMEAVLQACAVAVIAAPVTWMLMKRSSPSSSASIEESSAKPIDAPKPAEVEAVGQQDFLEAMQQLTQELLERRDLDELLQAIIERAAAVLDSPYGELALKDGDVMAVRSFTRNQPYRVGARLNRHEATLSWQAHDTGRPVVVTDYSALPARRKIYDELRLKAVAEFPIMHGAICIGVLSLTRTKPGHDFQPHEIQRGRLFAQVAALAIHNAGIYADAVREADLRTRALRDSEEKFRAAFEQTPLAVVLATLPDGKIADANAAAEVTFGRKLSDVMGLSTTELNAWVEPSDRDRYMELLQRNGFVTGYESRMRRSDGVELAVLCSGRVLDIGGQAYVLNSVLDITERKRAESALRESEEKFRGVFDKSPIPIALIALPEGEVVEVNQAAITAFGYLDKRLMGSTTDELGLWKHPRERETYIAELKEKGSITDLEVTMRNRLGEDISILLSGTLVHIDGRPHTLSSLFDITERKRAESKFRDLFEFAPDAIVIANGKGEVTDLNRRAQELLGYDRTELMSRSVETFVPAEVRTALMEGITHYFTIPGPLLMGTAKLSLKARSKSGRVFPVDISLSPLRSGEGVLVVAAIRETTQQLRAEAQQRTLEQQLRQAQKMDALGTLAGGIAHDFNNLLTVILTHTELAARAPQPGENLAAIRAAGLRSKELVGQILTFSRRTETARIPLRLQTVIEDALRLLRSTIPAMVRIDSFIDAKSPPVLADATQIHQVLMNLCTNAWHALPDRDGVIEVRLQPMLVDSALVELNPGLKAGPHVKLSVSDNGHGMSPRTLERIYEPFFTTKAVGQGTGLGLAMVHGIVHEHAGAISVRSEVGKGTTFELYFPALESTAEPAPEIPAAPVNGGGERILYVDDDKFVGEALTALLNHLGFRTTHQMFPHEALELFKARPHDFDLMITDRAMPGMTGGELAVEVLKIRGDLPVLLLTGYVDPVQEKELQRIGVREVLGKPLSAQKLGEAVRRAMKSVPGNAGAP